MTTHAARTTNDGGSATVRLTAAQALVRWLQEQHSERDGVVQRAVPAIFGIFGHGNVLGLGQAIGQEGDRLPLYQPKNEQAMVHTALGYAKAARRLQTLACTSSIGPGSTNMLTGAATATTNRLPVLLLPSDTFANRRQGPVLQQLEHPLEADLSVNDAFRPISRFFDRIARPEQLLTALPQAMRVLLDPVETGAVTVSLHQDVQGEAYDYPVDFFQRRIWPVTRRPPAASEVAAAADLLVKAERPLLIVGGGLRYSAAEDALRRFAEGLGIPVAETSAGKGSLIGSQWLVGGLGNNGTRVANELAHNADLVVCVGTRLSDFTTGSLSLFQRPDVRFVGVNVSASDAYKLGATAVVADAREALEALHTAARARRPSVSYGEEVRVATERWTSDVATDLAPRAGEPPAQGEVLLAVNDDIRAGDWVVAAAGWQPGDILKLWEVAPDSFTHIEFAFSCMGHEIPAGLGVRLHEGVDAEVIVVVGDGTFVMAPTELVTAVQESLKITLVVLDNGGYQSINGLAVGNTGAGIGNEFRRRGEDGRFPDGDPLGLDIAAMARSMGCASVTAGSIDELRSALKHARSGATTTVIVVPVAADRPVISGGAFWDLGVPEVADDPVTKQLTADFLERRGAQRSYQ